MEENTNRKQMDIYYKYKVDGSIERYKVRSLAKEFT